MLGGLTLLPLVAVSSSVPSAFADPGDAATAADTSYRYLSPHQAAVLDAATSRLIPGPGDDPGETTPGAREANVAKATLYSAFGSKDELLLALLEDDSRIGCGLSQCRSSAVPLTMMTAKQPPAMPPTA